jgi:hypothetical protein
VFCEEDVSLIATICVLSYPALELEPELEEQAVKSSMHATKAAISVVRPIWAAPGMILFSILFSPFFLKFELNLLSPPGLDIFRHFELKSAKKNDGKSGNRPSFPVECERRNSMQLWREYGIALSGLMSCVTLRDSLSVYHIFILTGSTFQK